MVILGVLLLAGLVSLGRSFDRIVECGTRDIMASGGRLLGLQLPPVPSHLSDFMPSCVRSAHNGDAKECCSLAPPNSTLPSSSGLLSFNPLCSKFSASGDTSADMSSALGESQAPVSQSSFALTCTEAGKVEAGKSKEKADAPPPSGWDGAPPSAESRPTTPPEEDVSGKELAGENSHPQGRGLRSKLSSMLSLEKRVSLGHSSQFMMEMSGHSFPRRAPMADSKLCVAIQKESFARMFDLYDERSIITSVPGYTAPGGYVPRSADGGDMGVRADLSWMEEKCNDAWGTEPWHSNQRNILMKTLHIMRCDIESLKVRSEACHNCRSAFS